MSIANIPSDRNSNLCSTGENDPFSLTWSMKITVLLSDATITTDFSPGWNVTEQVPYSIPKITDDNSQPWHVQNNAFLNFYILLQFATQATLFVLIMGKVHLFGNGIHSAITLGPYKIQSDEVIIYAS